MGPRPPSGGIEEGGVKRTQRARQSPLQRQQSSKGWSLVPHLEQSSAGYWRSGGLSCRGGGGWRGEHHLMGQPGKVTKGTPNSTGSVMATHTPAGAPDGSPWHPMALTFLLFLTTPYPPLVSLLPSTLHFHFFLLCFYRFFHSFLSYFSPFFLHFFLPFLLVSIPVPL